MGDNQQWIFFQYHKNLPTQVQNFAQYKINPQRIAKDFLSYAKVVKLWQIWSHCSRSKTSQISVNWIFFILFQHTSVETKAPESFSKLMSQLDEGTREQWMSFVAGKLAEVNERNTIVPVSSFSSKPMSSSEDDDADFRDINFPQESALQQV